MSYKARFDKGSWKVICDQCGREFKANQLRRRWDGLMVCDGDWEPRQPQDFVRGVADKMVPPYTRPEPQDSFIMYCTPTGISDIPYFAVPGCSIPGYIPASFDYSIAVPECIPIYVLADQTINDREYACNALIVSANLTLNGTVEIRNP